MAEIRIQGPDGSSFSFPEGTAGDVISRAMQAHYGSGATSTSPTVAVAPQAQGRAAPSGPDAAILGALDTATFGFLDEGAGRIDSWLQGRPYADTVADVRGQQRQAQDTHPYAYGGGQIAGAIGGGVGMGAAGLLRGVNAARSGAGLARIAGGSAVDGLAMGAASGAGSGEGMEDRAFKAGVGAIGGGLLGGATPLVTTAGGYLARAATAPLLARLRPEPYAQAAIGSTMRRAGATPDDVVRQLEAAAADGQGVFSVADALGHEGGRRLSSVVRTPNDARQTVVDTLTDRQMGQSERLSHALAEGFAAPDTAAQRVAGLTAQRSNDASANFGAARAGSGSVDPSGAIRAADDFLRPGAAGVLRNETGIADDGIEAAVRRARGYLTDGQSVLTDFNAAQRAKWEMDAMIEGARPAVQRQLIPIRNALDDSLSQASPDYANARDVFRRQSQAIDAVEAGSAANSGRTRADDNIARFGAMTPEEQSAFRAGYADPLIAKVEAAPLGATANRARMLMTGKSGQEFPAFAAPGRGEQMGNRIAREQRMAETANAALGGSKTADNAADQADFARYDPDILATAASGRPMTAVMTAVARALNEARGTPPPVADLVARALMETSPQRAREILSRGSAADQARLSRNAQIIAALNASGAAGAGRLAP